MFLMQLLMFHVALVGLFIVPLVIALAVNGQPVQNFYRSMFADLRHNAWILVVLFWVVSLTVVGYSVVPTPDSPIVEMARAGMDKVPKADIDEKTVNDLDSYTIVPVGTIAKYFLSGEKPKETSANPPEKGWWRWMSPSEYLPGGSWAWKIVPMFGWIVAVIAIFFILTDDAGERIAIMLASVAKRKSSSTVSSAASAPSVTANPSNSSSSTNGSLWSWLCSLWDEALLAGGAAFAWEFIEDKMYRRRRP